MEGLRFPMVGAGLESGCIAVELSMRLPRGGRLSVRGKAGEGIPNVSPSVDARGAARSPSDGMRASPSDLLRVIRGRSNGSGETRATALPKPSAALFAQVLLATNCTPARASLRDSLSLGGYALGFPPPAGVSPSPCAAKVPRPPLAGRWRRGGVGSSRVD